MREELDAERVRREQAAQLAALQEARDAPEVATGDAEGVLTARPPETLGRPYSRPGGGDSSALGDYRGNNPGGVGFLRRRGRHRRRLGGSVRAVADATRTGRPDNPVACPEGAQLGRHRTLRPLTGLDAFGGDILAEDGRMDRLAVAPRGSASRCCCRYPNSRNCTSTTALCKKENYFLTSLMRA